MIFEKEYPSTHSMDTTWYCVDADGNVGLFENEENGPVPDSAYTEEDLYVSDIFWQLFSKKYKGKLRLLNLKPEQIEQLLMPIDEKDKWKRQDYRYVTHTPGEPDEIDEGHYMLNLSWMNIIIKIDLSKLDILIEALNLDKEDHFEAPVWLAKDSEYFYVDFGTNREGVKLLEKNNVVIAKYKPVSYVNLDEDLHTKEDLLEIFKKNSKMPVYIYWQGYNPHLEPYIAANRPTNPLKIEQLPWYIRKKIVHLPILFEKMDKIQLAEYIPVWDGYVPTYYLYDGHEWCQLIRADGSKGYYCHTMNKIIGEEEMKALVESGEAEDYDVYLEKQRKLNDDY